MTKRFFFVISAYLIVLTGCSSTPARVELQELFGFWQTVYDGKSVFDEHSKSFVNGKGVDNLVLYPDSTFKNIFINSKGNTFSSAGTWEKIKASNDWDAIKLKGLKGYFYYLGKNETPTDTILLVDWSSNALWGKKTPLLCFEDFDLNICYKRTGQGHN